MTHLVALCLFAPLLAYLCWKDCRQRVLPNAGTFAFALLAAVWRFVADGAGGVMDGILGGLACAGFLLIPFLLKAAGGGDVKMLFAVGVLTGLRFCVAELLFVSIAGLLLGLFMVLTRRVVVARLVHCVRSVFDFRYDRAAGRAALPSAADERCRIPFGVAIALGTVVTLAYAWNLEAAP